MAQSTLQKITTSFHWFKYFSIQRIRIPLALHPFLSESISKKADTINCQIKSLLENMDKELKEAKHKIRRSQ